jgi:hypothetical protein
MKDTNKIKTAIKILRDIDAESKNNYFTINKTKYFVNKNLLFKNGVQVGSIKNGVMIFNKPLVKTKKATTKGTRKMKSTFKPVVDESISNTNLNKNTNSKMRRNTMRIKPVVNGSIPTYNPLIKNFSEPETDSMEEPVPLEEPVPEPVSEVSPVSMEPVSEVPMEEPVPEPETVPGSEEPYDEHKEDL